MLATYRPGYQPPWLDKSYATQLTLAPLSPEDSVQIVRVLLETETVPAPLAQTILAKAQGNPFFLEEIAQTLVEQGPRRREGGLGLTSAIQLPATVQGVLGARIDRLPADEKALLQKLAVIGHRCARRLLLQVAAEPEAEVSLCLTNLQAAELIYEQPATPEATYAFKHVLTQEVAFGGHFYQAEVYLLTGKLLLMQDVGGGMAGSPPAELSMIDGHEGEATGQSPRQTEAETWFRQALDIARQQQAKSLELRAAMSLSRLWQQQGQRAAAHSAIARHSTAEYPSGSSSNSSSIRVGA